MRYRVPLGSLRDWEQGRCEPDQPARAYLAVIAHEYQFRTHWAQRMYLGLSAYGGKVGFNAAAPVLPLVAAADRGARGDGGAIVLVRARRATRR